MKILVVEDERILSSNIVGYLSSDDYNCEQVFDLKSAVEKINLYSYDCILLDLNLPDGDGFRVLDEIKQRKIDSGVIIVSARGSLQDKIAGLKIGADDYLAKPFSLSELSIRIYALLRRRQYQHTNILKSNDVEIDLLSKVVFVNGRVVNLTKTEYSLLLFMVGNKNRVVSVGAVAEHLSGDMADMMDNYNFVYVHIKNLKSKLMNAGCSQNYIRTVYKLGYQWLEEKIS